MKVRKDKPTWYGYSIQFGVVRVYETFNKSDAFDIKVYSIAI